MSDRAFEVLKTYDWGVDPNLLGAIDHQIVATHDDAAARKKLEARLSAVLSGNVARAAKDFVCRKLRVIGTAASVPALAPLLLEAELSHMARYALESMPAPEAAAAMRDALPKLRGQLKAGVIGSLGARKDPASLSPLSTLLGDDDATVAAAAAHALGNFANRAAATALAEARPQSDAARQATTDASLACAEGLLRSGDKAEAVAVYRRMAKDDQPKHVRLAATRGMLGAKR